MKIHNKNYIIKTFTIIFIILISINQGVSQNTVGLILNDATQSYDGYTLFAPSTSTSTFLIDNEGRLVNQWESEFTAGLSAYLLEDGHLLRSAAIVDPTGGATTTGGFQKFDWGNNLVWEFYYGTQHHDIEPMPNGNVLMVVNDRKTKNEAIQAGRDPDLIGTVIRSLSILEIAAAGPTTGNVVWQWNAWDHLIQDFDNSKDNYGTVSEHPELIDINYAKDGGQDWLHTNSVAYNQDLDQIMVSNRHTNELWIIDHSTTTEEAATHTDGNSSKGGDLLYRWGNPIAYGAGTEDDRKLFEQHDAHWVGSGLQYAGNILIFNNGNGRPDDFYSSADEIVPPFDGNNNYELISGSAYGPTNIFWSYTAPVPTDFSSPRYGGTQRLPNRNTLICNSDKGEFLEVTSAKEIVWTYINPVTADEILSQGVITTDADGIWLPNNQVFRCYKYGADYPGFIGKDLTAGEPIELNPTTSINNEQGQVIKFRLYENYPNPFNPITNIEFSLTERIRVNISIYDLVGNKVRSLVSEIMERGLNTVYWDSLDDNGALVSSGVYFYRMKAGQQNQTQKMMLLR